MSADNTYLQVFCELLAYMTSTMLTRPNSCSVQGCTSSRICGASNDSVLLALMTSEVPPSMARVVIFTAFRNFCCKREKFGNILFYRYEQTAFSFNGQNHITKTAM